MSALFKTILLIVLTMAIPVELALAQNHHTIKKKQSISGANAFASKAGRRIVVVRISVNPGSLANNETTNKAIMRKMIVIACAAGTCHFTKPKYGLGFYETKFNFPLSFNTKQKIKLLVTACSKLGCVKKKIRLRYPPPVLRNGL